MGIIKGRLDNLEIKDALLKNEELVNNIGLTEQDVDDILQNFWFHDFYNSLLSYPVIYSYLEKYLIENSTTEVKRNDFYEYVVNSEIKESDRDKWYSLGFTLELFQQNGLEEDAFYSLCDQLEIPRGEISSNLVTKEAEKKPVKQQFLHHSIQEFLAFKYIESRPNSIDLIKHCMILDQEGVTAFKSTWSGVLRFLLSSSKKTEVLSWLIPFLSENSENLTDDLADLITYFDTDNVSQDILSDVFKLIYEYYMDNAIWINAWTRSNLWKFIPTEYKATLREVAELPIDDSERRYVELGNVASLIGPIVENIPEFFTQAELNWWYEVLITFAISDKGNGVLQRQALDSLEYFKKEDSLEKTKVAFEFDDQLVKEAYLQLCYAVAPNSEFSINYYIQAIKEGFSIFGRMGIYEITEPEALKYLIDKFVSDHDFLKEFLDKESIFGGHREKERTDRILIKRLAEVLPDNPNLLTKLKELSQQFISIEYGYYMRRRSYFIYEIFNLIVSTDVNYVQEIFEDIKASEDPRSRLIDYEDVLPFVLRDATIEFFKTEIVPYAHSKELPRYEDIVLRFERIKREKTPDEQGLEVGQEGVGSNIAIEDPRANEIYNEFANKLEPEKGKFLTDVFDFYLSNEAIISSKLTSEDSAKLNTLLTNLLEAANPEQIKVTIEDKSSGGKRYKIAPYAHYFGNLVQVANNFKGKSFIKKYRSKIINFIPFAYYDSQKTILETVETISDKDLVEVNKIYLDTSNDARYLLPESYIYTIKEYLDRGCHLKSPMEVLKSFIEDELIQSYDKRSALKLIGTLMENGVAKDKEYLLGIFEANKDAEDEAGKYLLEISNRLLICVFMDPYAISWRFQELKSKATPFQRERGVHTVGPVEEELDDMYFAKPLMELRDPMYLTQFMDLLDFTVSLLNRKDQDQYWNYVNYLWRVVTQYVKGLTQFGSFEPYFKLKDWYELRKTVNRLNWFGKTISDIFNFYVFEIGKVEIQKAIREYLNHDA